MDVVMGISPDVQGGRFLFLFPGLSVARLRIVAKDKQRIMKQDFVFIKKR